PPAGAHPEQGVGAQVAELLDRDRRRGTTDAGGGAAHRAPRQGAGPGRVLAVGGHRPGLLEEPGDPLHPPRVAGEEDEAAEVAGPDLEVVGEPGGVAHPSTTGSRRRMSGTSMTTSAAAAVSAPTGQKATPSPASRNMSMSPLLSPTATISAASTPRAATVSWNTGSLPPGGTRMSASPVNSPSATWRTLATWSSMPRSSATRSAGAERAPAPP